MITESATNCLHESIRLRDNSARSSDGKASDAELVGAIARGDQLSMRQLYEGGFNWSAQHLLILLDEEVADGDVTDIVHGEAEG